MMKHFLGILLVAAMMPAVCRAASECTAESADVQLDLRTPLGKVLSGTRRISPVAETEDDRAKLLVDGATAPGWSVANPYLDSTRLANGWHRFRLQTAGGNAEVELMVLNGGDFRLADDGWIYLVTNSQATILGHLDRNATALVIPGTLENVRVTALGDRALAGQSKLKNLTLPATLVELGPAALEGCTALKEVVLPDSLQRLGDGAFRGCTGLSVITIPAGVTAIGEGVFAKCTGLKSFAVAPGNPAFAAQNGLLMDTGRTRLVAVPTGLSGALVLPATVTAIDAGAFWGCTKLTSVILPEGVAEIGDETFAECVKLATVGIPASVQSIGEGAFRGCAALKSIAVPEGVQSIGAEAFAGCKALAAATLPTSLTSLDATAFAECKNLKTATFAGTAPALSGEGALPAKCAVQGYASNGWTAGTTFCGATVKSLPVEVRYEVRGAKVAVLGLANPKTTSLAIPAMLERRPVAVIADGAFAGQAKLKGVTLPGTMEAIGAEAFAGCTALTSIALPASVTAIGEGAFADCKALKAISVAEGNPAYQAIGGALYTADGRTLVAVSGALAGTLSVPEGVRTIAAAALCGCAKLKSVKLPVSLAVVGSGAFAGCTSLTAFALGDGNATFSVAAGMLLSADGTRLIAVPGGIAGAVALPASVEELAEGAFAGCAKATSVTLAAGLAEIPASCFENCVKLSIVGIPASVQSIGEGAFRGCTALKSIAVPEGVQSIGAEAFAGCKALAAATLPTSLTSLDATAFAECKALKTATFAGTAPALAGEGALPAKCAVQGYASNGWTAGVTFCGATVKNLPVEVRYEVRGAKVAVLGLANPKTTSLTIPAMLERRPVAIIADGAFEGQAKLKGVTLPGTMETIGAEAFAGCTKLTSIALPASITAVGEGAFAGCKALKAISVAGGNPAYQIVGGALYTADGRTLVAVPGTLAGTLSVPDGVTAIARGAAAGCAKLKAIRLPDSLNSIGDAAFENCTALSKLTIPAGVIQIGGGFLAGCKAMTMTSLAVAPGNTTFVVEDGALYALAGGHPARLLYVPGTTTGVFVVPEGVTELSEGAFAGCTKLTGAVLPQGLAALPSRLFANCTALVEIRVPDGCTVIGEEAFAGCTKLASVVLPDSVRIIGDGAFYGCKAMAMIMLPPALATIGEEAFRGCAKLAALAIPAGVSVIGDGAFDQCAKLLDLFFLGETAPSTLGTTVLANKARVHAAWDGTYGANAKGVPFATIDFAPAVHTLVISGATLLAPGGKTTYTATIDGIDARPAWSIACGAKTAKIDKNGVLTVGKAVGAQPIILRAVVAVNGCPVTAFHTATIEDGLYGAPADVAPRAFTVAYGTRMLHVVPSAATAAILLAQVPSALVALYDDAACPINVPQGTILRASHPALQVILPDGTAVSADGFAAPDNMTLLLAWP